MSSYLKVTVVEAKGIASSKRVYASVTVLNSNGQKVGKEVKTPTVKGTVNPTWGSSFVFTVDEEFAGMSVRLYEKPVLPVADRFIGVVTIRLMNERIKYKKFDKWYPLAKLTQHQNVSGELRLDIDFRDPDLGDVKKRKKMKDRSISISGDVSPPEAKLPVDILARGNTNPRSPSPSNTSNGDRSNRSNGSSGPASPASSPSSTKMSPTFARKTSFERRGASSINDKKAARASVAVSKFQLDSYFKQQPDSATTSEDTKTDTDTDSEIKPMKIGAFSVAQRGGARRGRRSSEEVEEGYATTSAVSPRAGRSPVSVVDPKRQRGSPAADENGNGGKRTKVKRVSTLDIDIPEPKSPISGKKRSPATPVQETKTAPMSADSKAARRAARKENTDSVGVGYSTDYTSSQRTKKVKVRDAPDAATSSTPKSAAASSPSILKKPAQTPFSDVEDSPSSKHRRRRKDATPTDVEDDRPEFHAPISEPIIVPIKNASPTKRTPTASPGGSRNGSPSKRPVGPEGVLLGPLVVERQRGSDRSKRLSMQLGYATDAPPSRPRGSSAEKKKSSSSRKGSREADALPAATEAATSAASSAPVILNDSKATDSPRKKKRMFAKADSPRVQADSPRSDPESPKTAPVAPVEASTEESSTAESPRKKNKKDKVHVAITEAAEAADVAVAPSNVEISKQEPIVEVQDAVVAAQEPASSSTPVDVADATENAAVEPDENAPKNIESDTSTAVIADAVAPTAQETDKHPELATTEAALSASSSSQSLEVSSTEESTKVEVVTTETTETTSETPVDDTTTTSAAAAPAPAAVDANQVATEPETDKQSDATPTDSIVAPATISPSSSGSNISSPGASRSKIDRTSSIVESAATRTLSRQTSIKEVLSTDDPLAKSQLMKNFFTGLGVTKKK